MDLIEAAFASFHILPLADYIGIPFTVFTQLRLCLGMLLHLSTMDCPGWDKMDVRRRIDVLAVAGRMVGDFSEASVLYSGRDEEAARDDPLARIAGHLDIMRNAFATKVRQSDSDCEGGVLSGLTPTSAGDLCMAELPDMADFLDLDWLAGVI